MLERIEDNTENLNMKEKIYFYKIKQLIELQLSKIELHINYPNVLLLNAGNYKTEQNETLKEEIKKERIVCLTEKEIIEKLIDAWKKNSFIDNIETEKILSIFCDIYGNLFTTYPKEKMKWNKRQSELTYFFRLLIDPSNKIISDNKIWVKVSKCFLVNDVKSLMPSSLAVSSQKGNPKSKDLIKRIVKSLPNDQE